MAWRLLAAFLLVVATSVGALTVAALAGTDQGLAAAAAAARQQAAVRVADTAGAAYAAAGGWPGARLEAAYAVAAGASARLFVRDQTGAPVSGGQGGGHGMGPPSGTGSGMASGDSGRVSAPVVVSGRTVGSVQLAFGTQVGPSARSIAWQWIAVAAGVSLVVALGLSWFVSGRIGRPVARLAATARALSAGDRGARSGVRGPGELGELGAAFDSMAGELARAEQAHRDLTADVAHELRNPLASLRAGLEELRDGFAEPDAQRLSLLHDQTLRLGRVVDDLAELSEAETAGPSLRLSKVDLASVARAALAAHEPALRAAGMTTRTDLAAGLSVQADADRLHQALGNILGNAARYGRPGDTVTVRTWAAGEYAVVRIADTGPGIPADELPHVFDRLWRGRGGRAVAGSGIGLAVARELVTAHHGTIQAESGQPGGTAFTIRLPRPPAN